MKKLLIAAVLLMLLESCQRQFSPQQAADRRMKCNRGVIR